MFRYIPLLVLLWASPVWADTFHWALNPPTEFVISNTPDVADFQTDPWVAVRGEWPESTYISPKENLPTDVASLRIIAGDPNCPECAAAASQALATSTVYYEGPVRRAVLRGRTRNLLRAILGVERRQARRAAGRGLFRRGSC